MITEEQLQWRLWAENPSFPKLDDRHKMLAERFFERLTGQEFLKPLYLHC